MRDAYTFEQGIEFCEYVLENHPEPELTYIWLNECKLYRATWGMINTAHKKALECGYGD